MNTNYDAERWAEYEDEKAAVEREAFEDWCDEQDIDSTTEEAALAWRAFCEEEQRRNYEDQMVEEYQWRMQDLEEERNLLWE